WDPTINAVRAEPFLEPVRPANTGSLGAVVAHPGSFARSAYGPAVISETIHTSHSCSFSARNACSSSTAWTWREPGWELMTPVRLLSIPTMNLSRIWASRRMSSRSLTGGLLPSGPQPDRHYHISSTRTATPGRRPYDFDARSSTTAESSAITSPVNASSTALASLSTSGRPGHCGADSFIFWALRPVP